VKNAKRILIILLVAVLAFTFTACSGSKEGESTQNTTTGETKVDKTNEQTEQKTDNTGKKITFLLTYPKEKEVLYQTLADFTKETGIELEIQYMPLEESRKQINVMVASDSLPDVMDVDNTDTAAYVKMGILADITDKVEKEIEIDKYYEGPIGQNRIDGKFYGLPFTTNNLCLYYNKDMFAQAGIENPPQTWNEILDACAKLKAIGVNGFGVAGGQTTDTSFQMWPFIWGAGSDHTKLDSPETVELLNFYKALVDNNYMSTEVVNYNAGDNANQFIAGKTAMIIDGPWRLNAIRSGVTFNFGVAKVPEGPAGFKTVLGGHNFAIVDNENVDLSWEFVKYMNRPDVMLRYSEAENYIPARKDVAAQSDYFSSEPIVTFVEMAEYARAMPVENYNKISDAIIEMFQSVVLGAKTPEQAAKDAGAAVAALK